MLQNSEISESAKLLKTAKQTIKSNTWMFYILKAET